MTQPKLKKLITNSLLYWLADLLLFCIIYKFIFDRADWLSHSVFVSVSWVTGYFLAGLLRIYKFSDSQRFSIAFGGGLFLLLGVALPLSIIKVEFESLYVIILEFAFSLVYHSIFDLDRHQ